jgi:hypothetical protein
MVYGVNWWPSGNQDFRMALSAISLTFLLNAESCLLNALIQK